MTAVDILAMRSVAAELPRSFEAWHEAIFANNRLPIIGVAGTRGKSTVVRLLDAIFTNAGLRTATWTDLGVEIRGRRQTGELGPWSRVFTRLQTGTLDIAIQELDWPTVHAVGLPRDMYPVMAVTNLCANNDACLVHEQTAIAIKAHHKILNAVSPSGVLVLNGEDYAVAGSELSTDAPIILVARSRETPLLRTHLAAGGTAVWVEGDRLQVGTDQEHETMGAVSDLSFALGGRVAFAVHNALTAAAIARAVGIPASVIAKTLAHFTFPVTRLPGSFNVARVNGGIVVVDRPTMPWFLRPILRAMGHVHDPEVGRLITVVGNMTGVEDEDLVEIGRMIGRASDAIVMHSHAGERERAQRLRAGIAQNSIPPVLVHVKSERQAIQRALRALRPTDAVLILAEYPAAALSQVHRAAMAPAGTIEPIDL